MRLTTLGSAPPPSFEDPAAVLAAGLRALARALDGVERAAAGLPATPPGSGTPDPGAAEVAGALAAHLAELARLFGQNAADLERSVLPRLPGQAGGPYSDLPDEHRVIEVLLLAAQAVTGRMLDVPSVADRLAVELCGHLGALGPALRAHLARAEELLPAVLALPASEREGVGLEMQARRVD